MHYGGYAKEYDLITSKIGMNDQYHMAQFLQEQFPDLSRDSKAIDFGCGTGLAGEQLAKLGYTVIDGNDGSQDMLKIAKEKSCYRKLFPLMIGTDPLPEDLERDYDIVVSTACLIRSHFPNTCFNEFLDVLKQGGLLVITCREIYLHNETDEGMDYIGVLRAICDKALAEDPMSPDVTSKKLTFISEQKFRKYDGLEEIEGVH